MKTISALLGLSAIAVIFLFRNHAASVDAYQASAESRIVQAVASYKSWPRATASPARYDAAIAALCAAPTATPPTSHGPHTDKFIMVYVNEIGRRALLEQKNPAFAEGSIIVKEKLPSATGATPELLTVMLKRDSGFNPETGDWEFAVLDGSANKILASGKIDSCSSCHSTRRDNGFVFRTYVSSSVRAQWR